MRYDEVMLIRCAPHAAGAQQFRAVLDSGPPALRLLFFHGPGLAWANRECAELERIADESGSTLMLCSSGWRRRYAEAAPAGWQLGSLIQFWDAADRAERVLGFGDLA